MISVEPACQLPVIRTKSLRIRLLQPEDAHKVVAYYSENKRHFAEYSPAWPDEYYKESYWKKKIDSFLYEFETGKSARFYIFDANESIIGNVSLSGIIRGPAQFCFIGYAIAESHQGKGLMYEAVEAVVDYGFTKMNLHRIMANYVPTNQRSKSLLNRLGFIYEGYARNYLQINGSWQDHVMTAITNHQWSGSDENLL